MLYFMKLPLSHIAGIYNGQDKLSKYNVILSRIRVNIVAVEKLHMSHVMNVCLYL